MNFLAISSSICAKFTGGRFAPPGRFAPTYSTVSLNKRQFSEQKPFVVMKTSFHDKNGFHHKKTVFAMKTSFCYKNRFLLSKLVFVAKTGFYSEN